MSVDREILESIREAGTKRFSKVKKTDRILYGKEFGKDSLTAFAKYIDPKFEDPLHIKSIIHLLERMEKGEIQRGIINMPPRRGKSQICTRIFPAWFLGRHPDKNVILLSYSDNKAARFGRWVRDCVESNRFSQIFPNTKVRPDMRAAAEWETTSGGLVLSAGLKGGFNGDGADLLIVDDPYKNREEATSETISEKIIENFMSVGETRLSPNAIILIVHTRWLRNDLTGRLIGEDKEVESETF
ncbi:terminase large subunit domain-containing protein [Leptospira weilii]|uniref:terminase large subunit domain-containing protein n=1 Tax=Leptospira weilii TaxID=28184 RepID=UPI001157D899|nr:terminase family protein [Leptospira weilii]QDK22960.1 Terminase-like domain protein [Leptospira weilii]QDK27396.1 Terminase-like domain protein [Leptospira weilii]